MSPLENRATLNGNQSFGLSVIQNLLEGLTLNCLPHVNGSGGLYIHIPDQVEQLRARLEQLEWLREVKEVLEDPSEISTDVLTGLEHRGCSLKPRTEVAIRLSGH